MKNLRSQLDNEFDPVYIFLDGCVAQFWSRYVFYTPMEDQKDINIAWNYVES